MLDILKELLIFIKERKKWFLIPIIFILLLVGILVLASGSTIAPFIYTLF